ncbi:hypothetical protein [Streptomyces sp. SLBN-134]|uniref:hypothetical protein n=1 Tax=Streptomyces sp. SLBN-134 TaxID=2768456 RepID=UPI0011529773|nr:hypothetical protein [Streptomyces sp. SLBN-134]
MAFFFTVCRAVKAKVILHVKLVAEFTPHPLPGFTQASAASVELRPWNSMAPALVFLAGPVTVMVTGTEVVPLAPTTTGLPPLTTMLLASVRTAACPAAEAGREARASVPDSAAMAPGDGRSARAPSARLRIGRGNSSASGAYGGAGGSD